MTLDAHEFIRRFLLHVIPKGFVRVRHFGFLANRSKSLLSKCRQLLALNPAVPKLPSKLGADAPTDRHRYHSMPSMPKGNSGLPCRPARPHSMGFFVMIAQRTDCQVFPALCTSANTSVRPVSSFYLFSADFLFGRASQLISLVNSNAARSSHDHQCCDVCSARCPRSNPHRQLSLLHPTL